MPLPAKPIQVDGGSEFQAQFEQACVERSIRLFVLPPRSPKLNSHMERAQRTHKGELYAHYEVPLELPGLDKALRRWERVYNTIRSHHALGRKPPAQNLRECFPNLAPAP